MVSKVYINNGTSLVESQQWQQNLTNINRGSTAFGDIDNDGDLDLALVGCSSGGGDSCNNYTSKIYINNGTSLVESLQWESNLTSLYWGGVAFGDVNNDGKLDLALTGELPTTNPSSKIYINNGTSLVESLQWESNLTQLRRGSLTFGDIDNDGDLDLIISGQTTGIDGDAKIYINNGTSLVENSVWEENLIGKTLSSSSFGDIDNDGKLDLIIIGLADSLRIYRNNGTTFLLSQWNNATNDLVGVYDGSIHFGDYDNDGNLDLAVNGNEGYSDIYLNNNSVFDRDTKGNSILDLRTVSSIIWADLDNDTDLDLIETGFGGGGGGDFQAKVYISNASLTRNNTKPSPPNSSFSSSYVNNILTLNWGNGSDSETNTSGLYYNLMAGNSTKNNTIVSGVYGGSSNPTAGYFGNMMQRKSIVLNVQLEANKTYYWYVQTIDTGLAKSNWSVMQNFTTAIDVTKPNITINNPTPNASLHTTNPYFIFNATVTDANLTNVTLNANWTGSWHINQSNSSGINGTYTFTVNLTNNNDGHYAWYIGTNDSSNNSETSPIRDFYLDRAYPLAYLVSPANSGVWTSSSTVTFSYNVSDVDIANCSLVVNNAIVNTSTSVSENTQQNFTYSLSNGNYNWQVNCSDYVGYTNSSSIYSLTVSYTPPSSTSGGGGGGGSTTAYKTYAINDEQLLQGYTQILFKNDKIEFLIANENHSLTLDNLSTNLSYANLTLNSTAINFIIHINETRKFELTNDNYYELLVRLNDIKNNKANLTIKQIYEEIKEEIGKKAKEEVEKKKEEIKKKKLRLWIILAVIVVVALVVLIKFLKKYIKDREWKKIQFNWVRKWQK